MERQIQPNNLPLDQLEKALRAITENFQTGFSSSTCLNWTRVYDEQGRPLNVDPNYQKGIANVKGKTYFFTRKGWLVWVYDQPVYHSEAVKNVVPLLTLDLTPDYLKDNAD